MTDENLDLELKETEEKPKGYGIIWLRGEIEEEKHTQFINQFNELLEDEAVGVIKIHICSPGGSYMYGMSIFEEIRLSEKPTMAVIQGNAHSIAAIISQAADKIIMTENSTLMFHPPLTVFGEGMLTVGEVETISDRGLLIEKKVLEILSQKTGKIVKQMKKFVGLERCLDAHEALKHGFVDGII